MGFFTNLFRQKAEPKTNRPNPTGYETASYGYTGLSTDKQSDYLKEMKGWVFACVSAIADEIAAINIKLYKKKGDKIEEITEHPILDLLYKVNDFTTKFDQFWLTAAYLELVGEAPWFLERTGKEVTGIYFLRPDRLEIIPDKKTIIKGYKYDIGDGEKITLKPEEVIFLKYPSPITPLRGLGTLEAASRTVDVDNYSEEWNWRFFKNNATPGAVLTTKNPQMTEEQKIKLKASIEKKYQGVEKAHQIMVLFGDMDLKQFGFSQTEMGFEAQQKMTRDKILGMFRVPKAILAQTEGVNFASAKTANYVFARWTIRPKMERIVQQLNEFLVPLFLDGENLFLDYVNPIPEDEEAKLNYYDKALKSGWMSINEVRLAEEMLPLTEGGDSIYMPLNVLPIGDTPKQKSMAYDSKRLIHLRARTKLERKANEEVEKGMKEAKEEVKKEILRGMILTKDLKKGIKDDIKKEIKTTDKTTEVETLVDSPEVNGQLHPSFEEKDDKGIRSREKDNSKKIESPEDDKGD